MSQPRVFEFAKEIGMETLALMDKIKEWDLPVKNHMASLSDDLIAEIKTRLNEKEASEPKTKKKASKKKATTKKASTTKASSTKKTTKKAAGTTKKKATKKATASAAPVSVKKASKVVTKKTAAAAAAAATAPTQTEEEPQQARRLVIRRSGQDEDQAPDNIKIMRSEDLNKATPPKVVETAATQAAAQAEAQQEGAADLGSSAQTAATDAAGTDAATTMATSATGEPAADAVKKPSRKTLITKKNIIGRMDLSRVKNMSNNNQDPNKPRPAAPRARNLRTGFVAAEPMVPVVDEFDRKKEDFGKRKKIPAAGAPQEGAAAVRGLEAPTAFKSADFRKREAVFQPKKKKVSNEPGRKTEITTPAAHKRIVKVHGSMTVSQLAQEMGLKLAQLTRALMAQGVMGTPNTELDFDTISLIVPEFNWEAQNVLKTSDDFVETLAFGDLDADLMTRAPVVTVMGHVDHGKTTLLDTIRKANVVKGEAGGITQHIGAYRVILEDGTPITFIDTPGHEAFTSMRARGANVTDIAIIVVAADDGMMPQTQEAINHAKAADVPIIVAVNKMDKEAANPDRIKQQLTEFELVPEEWGGTTIYNHVSALKGEGIKELLENIHLVAELQELKANPKKSGTGIVIESSIQKGRGTVATILVQDGTVRTGDHICAGKVPGKIRQMINDQGQMIKEAGPGIPVQIMGLPETPSAGDRFDVCKDEVVAQKLAELRAEEQRQAEEIQNQPAKNMTLDSLFTKVKLGDVKELPLVIKTDVAGSIEAIKGLLNKIESDEVKIKYIHSAVGGINESDVLLAGTAGGIVLGFNVRPDTSAANVAKQKGVEVKCYSVIYEMVDEVKKSMSGLLSPDIVEKAQGKAEVRDIFSIPKIGVIAGCFVTEGKIHRADQVRLVRQGKVIYTGKLSSLKRFKDDAKEVASGFECGIGIENYNDVKVGDIMETFVLEEVAREL